MGKLGEGPICHIAKQTYHTGTVRRRVANFAPREHGELALDAIRGLDGRSHDVQGADTLAVQPSVLRETLPNTRLVPHPRCATYERPTWHTSSGTSLLTNSRTAQASLSRSPLAKPW